MNLFHYRSIHVLHILCLYCIAVTCRGYSDGSNHLSRWTDPSKNIKYIDSIRAAWCKIVHCSENIAIGSSFLRHVANGKDDLSLAASQTYRVDETHSSRTVNIFSSNDIRSRALDTFPTIEPVPAPTKKPTLKSSSMSIPLIVSVSVLVLVGPLAILLIYLKWTGKWIFARPVRTYLTDASFVTPGSRNRGVVTATSISAARGSIVDLDNLPVTINPASVQILPGDMSNSDDFSNHRYIYGKTPSGNLAIISKRLSSFRSPSHSSITLASPVASPVGSPVISPAVSRSASSSYLSVNPIPSPFPAVGDSPRSSFRHGYENNLNLLQHIADVESEENSVAEGDQVGVRNEDTSPEPIDNMSLVPSNLFGVNLSNTFNSEMNGEQGSAMYTIQDLATRSLGIEWISSTQ